MMLTVEKARHGTVSMMFESAHRRARKAPTLAPVDDDGADYLDDAREAQLAALRDAEPEQIAGYPGISGSLAWLLHDALNDIEEGRGASSIRGRGSTGQGSPGDGVPGAPHHSQRMGLRSSGVPVPCTAGVPARHARGMMTIVAAPVNKPSLSAPRIGTVSIDRLSPHLLQAARNAARSVLRTYGNATGHQRLNCAMEAGAAAEWLLRAFLARHNPALLADRRNPDSLLVLAGIASLPGDEHLKLHTIMASDAIALALKIRPALVSIRADFDFVMAVRNSAAHSAVWTPSSMDESVRRLVRLVSVLLPEFGARPGQFWGGSLQRLADGIIADFENAIAARVASKIAAAEDVVRTLTAGLPPDRAAVLLAGLEARPVNWTLGAPSVDEPYPCPACGHRAWVTYLQDVIEDGEVEQVYDAHGDVESEYVSYPVSLIPMFLQCPVCGLSLDNSDDELSGFPDIEERPGEPVLVDDPAYLALDEPAD